MDNTEELSDMEQFAQWCSEWEQDSKSKEFQLPRVELEDDFESSGEGCHDSDAYWDYLSGDPELLSEDTTPNPIYPDSVGKDQTKPEPAWTDEKLLGEVESLKKRLYDIEVKIGKKEGGGDKWVTEARPPYDGVRNEVKELMEKIDKLSNRLGVDKEPAVSQWKTKEG